jgi:hypothetical protein
MDQKAPIGNSRDAAIEKIVDLCLMAGSLSELSDKYFTHTRGSSRRMAMWR